MFKTVETGMHPYRDPPVARPFVVPELRRAWWQQGSLILLVTMWLLVALFPFWTLGVFSTW